MATLFLGPGKRPAPAALKADWIGRMGVKGPGKGSKWGMVQNACHSGNSSGPLDGSGVLQRLLPAAERRNFIAWRREPQGNPSRRLRQRPHGP